MGIFTKASNRLLRTPWQNVQQAMQEVYAVFRSDAPIDVTSPVNHRGDVTYNGGSGAGGISIARDGGGGTQITFGQRTGASYSGPADFGSSLSFNPKRTTVVNDQGQSVSFDDYIGRDEQPQPGTSGGDRTFFGTVAEDTVPGSLECSVVLEGDERRFVRPRTVDVRLFRMHPDGQLHQGDPLTIHAVESDDGTVEYRAQPPTWLG